MSWIGDNAVNLIDSLLGVAGLSASAKHYKEEERLAREQQQFNEAFSTQQLQLQADQFEKNYNQAQQNIDFQKDIAEKNLAMQQDVFNAQLQENALTRQREDTAIQRQVKDLKEAGLSPLMATGGASSVGQTLASAPQYDMTGVSNTQGSALQLAQEYAQLRNASMGDYLSRRQQAVNARIGAKQAYNQLVTQQIMQGQNLALQTRNLKQNIKESEERIESSKQQRIWMSENGYRNMKFEDYVVSALSSIWSPAQAGQFAKEIINEVKNNGINKAIETVNEVKNIPNEIKKGIENNLTETITKVDDFQKNVSLHTTQKISASTDKSLNNAYHWFKPGSDNYKNALGKYYDKHKEWFNDKIYKWQFMNLSKKQLADFRKNPSSFINNF